MPHFHASDHHHTSTPLCHVQALDKKVPISFFLSFVVVFIQMYRHFCIFQHIPLSSKGQQTHLGLSSFVHSFWSSAFSYYLEHQRQESDICTVYPTKSHALYTRFKGLNSVTTPTGRQLVSYLFLSWKNIIFSCGLPCSRNTIIVFIEQDGKNNQKSSKQTNKRKNTLLH